MLLTVDVGNTQTAIGLFEGRELRMRWAVSTRATDTVDEIHLLLAGLLDLDDEDMGEVTDAIIASVVPPLTGCWAGAARRLIGTDPLVVGPGIKTGLPMHFDNPAEVGADRVADAVGALDLVGAPVVVVDLGTATNIEVVDRDGAFRGGIIAPGLGTSASDLAAHAARLPMVDLSFPEYVVGTNTNDAMRSGLMFGEVARVDGLVAFVFEELGYEAPVIVTGGFAKAITGYSQIPMRHEPDLTLHGLRTIYDRNKKSK